MDWGIAAFDRVEGVVFDYTPHDPSFLPTCMATIGRAAATLGRSYVAITGLGAIALAIALLSIVVRALEATFAERYSPATDGQTFSAPCADGKREGSSLQTTTSQTTTTWEASGAWKITTIKPWWWKPASGTLAMWRRCNGLDGEGVDYAGGEPENTEPTSTSSPASAMPAPSSEEPVNTRSLETNNQRSPSPHAERAHQQETADDASRLQRAEPEPKTNAFSNKAKRARQQETAYDERQLKRVRWVGSATARQAVGCKANSSKPTASSKRRTISQRLLHRTSERASTLEDWVRFGLVPTPTSAPVNDSLPSEGATVEEIPEVWPVYDLAYRTNMDLVISDSEEEAEARSVSSALSVDEQPSDIEMSDSIEDLASVFQMLSLISPTTPSDDIELQESPMPYSGPPLQMEEVTPLPLFTVSNRVETMAEETVEIPGLTLAEMPGPSAMSHSLVAGEAPDSPSTAHWSPLLQASGNVEPTGVTSNNDPASTGEVPAPQENPELATATLNVTSTSTATTGFTAEEAPPTIAAEEAAQLENTILAGLDPADYDDAVLQRLQFLIPELEADNRHQRLAGIVRPLIAERESRHGIIDLLRTVMEDCVWDNLDDLTDGVKLRTLLAKISWQIHNFTQTQFRPAQVRFDKHNLLNGGFHPAMVCESIKDLLLIAGRLYTRARDDLQAPALQGWPRISSFEIVDDNPENRLSMLGNLSNLLRSSTAQYDAAAANKQRWDSQLSHRHSGLKAAIRGWNIILLRHALSPAVKTFLDEVASFDAFLKSSKIQQNAALHREVGDLDSSIQVLLRQRKHWSLSRLWTEKAFEAWQEDIGFVVLRFEED